ncbi:acyltransferase [Gillisia limnaea]|uniref:Acyltransferase n=1 Tax=Gillisia limnaea (strain DSM 15749 / LMG 21470 / R-8282) TaxID=865937 RepID=H2BT59_GILLR|nr:hypothetical protein [Gillisia limnaea]EHQ02617.1 hypothetical protein Gilli_1979 [Gillisia limnaea DSM 15749]
MDKIKKILLFFMPWYLRRRALIKWFGYDIHPTSRLGFCWVFPRELVMKAHSRIDHFTVAIHLDRIEMEENSSIGRSNWITGFPSGTSSRHFQHQTTRTSVLMLGSNSSITKHHHLDCTNLIRIGNFSTIAGYHTQILTHSIDLLENIQDSKPIIIGDYTFIGTNTVILGGANLPNHCVLGAKSMLNKVYHEKWKLYGGVPAQPLRDIPKSAKYFSRVEGFVY